jgi:hypothetical protein
MSQSPNDLLPVKHVLSGAEGAEALALLRAAHAMLNEVDHGAEVGRGIAISDLQSWFERYEKLALAR